MSKVEIMAWVVVVLSAVKTVVVLTRPEVWLKKVTRVFYGNSVFLVLSLVLGAGGLYYLLQELTIVQVFAAMFVFMFLYAAAMMPYAKQILPTLEKELSTPGALWKKSWPVIVIWVGLLVWAVSALVA